MPFLNLEDTVCHRRQRCGGRRDCGSCCCCCSHLCHLLRFINSLPDGAVKAGQEVQIADDVLCGPLVMSDDGTQAAEKWHAEARKLRRSHRRSRKVDS